MGDVARYARDEMLMETIPASEISKDTRFCQRVVEDGILDRGKNKSDVRGICRLGKTGWVPR